MKNILGIAGLSPQEYAISANAFLGIRDSGKTYDATKAAEELYEAGIPFVALDPIGVWHWLRVPGKGKGYPVVVAGGKRADLPLTVKNVGEIVRAAMKANVSLVIDLFSMELSKADWKRIVRETVEILLHENADYGQRHVFIEEAAEFVPQRMSGGIDGQVFAAVEKLVRMGGNSKLGCTLINQRSADLNKSVLELCATVLVHRQTGKNTLLDLKKWFEVMALDKETQGKISTTLPHLKSGTCWVLSTELKKPLLLHVAEKNSLHPDRRAISKPDAVPVKAVSADVFVAQMKAALEKKPAPIVAAKAIAPVGVSISMPPAMTPHQLQVQLDAAERRGEETVRAMIPAMLDTQHTASVRIGFKQAYDEMRVALANYAELPLDRIPRRENTVLIPKADLKRPMAPAKPPLSKAPVMVAPDGGVTKPQAAILGALRWWAAVGHGSVTRAQLAAKAKFKVSGGHFLNRLSELNRAGLIRYPDGGMVEMTADGERAAPIPDMSGTVTDNIRDTLTAPQKKLFDALVKNWGTSAASRDDLAQAAEFEAGGGHFLNRLSELNRMEIIIYPSKGMVQLQSWVF